MGAGKSRASPPALMTAASSVRYMAARLSPASPCSMKTSALPGATAPRIFSSVSRLSLERRSGPGSVMTATVPPPNIGAVLTCSAIADVDVSLPCSRQRSGASPVACSRRFAMARTALSSAYPSPPR